MAAVKSFFKSLIRRKPIDCDLSETKLNRCLSTLDLTALGIGSTLGLGIYVLAGQVASEKAGPAVTLSFLIAALASVFAGLCYAEFGSRVPRAGSAYVYSYVTVGELMAFIIGWNLILEYVIGTASVARGYSGYVDSLFEGVIQKTLTDAMPMNIQNISAYPDFLALVITLFLTIMLAVGVKESTRFNNIFTALNLLVVIFAIVAGAIKSDIHNWKLDKVEDKIPEGAGEGGFLPFGFSGMMAGAATCFYGFIGFDCIATTGEEVRNPQKSIPISIVLSLFCVFLAYFGVSAVQTLMVPYYLQNNSAPLPFVFSYVGWPFAKWIITIGALAGLSTSLLGAMFPLPRVLYAMASDGVIFRFFAKIHPRLKTPLIATLFSGVFAGCMAMMFNVNELADMMSIGTLLAYTLVAVSVLILRYQDDNPTRSRSSSQTAYSSIIQSPEKCDSSLNINNINGNKVGSSHSLSNHMLSIYNLFRQLLNANGYKVPTKETTKISYFLIISIGILIVILDGTLSWGEHLLIELNVVALLFVAIITFVLLVFLLMLYRQPVENKKISFKVPLIPFIPVLSIFVNMYLMFKLSFLTWKRFGIWMIIGFCIYFFYGLWNSTERYVTSSDPKFLDKNETRGIICSDQKSSVGSCMSELTVCQEPKNDSTAKQENSSI